MHRILEKKKVRFRGFLFFIFMSEEQQPYIYTSIYVENQIYILPCLSWRQEIVKMDTTNVTFYYSYFYWWWPGGGRLWSLFILIPLVSFSSSSIVLSLIISRSTCGLTRDAAVIKGGETFDIPISSFFLAPEF